MRRSRVFASFAEVTQQIHSLRASGVMSSQVALAALSLASAFFMSAGSICTGPPAVSFLPMLRFYQEDKKLTEACLKVASLNAFSVRFDSVGKPFRLGQKKWGHFTFLAAPATDGRQAACDLSTEMQNVPVFPTRFVLPSRYLSEPYGRFGVD